MGITPKDLGIDDSQDSTPVIGGQIITPTARLVGEIDDKAATQRGWLRGIEGAFQEKQKPEAERSSNVQAIVDEAIKAGVPREKIGEHLASLGINAVAKQAEQPPLDEVTTQNALNYIGTLAESVAAGRSDPGVLKTQLKYLERRGVPREQLEEILRSKGITPTRETESPQAQPENSAKQLNLRIQDIVNKLATKFPDQPGGTGRMGYEITLSEDDLTALRQFLQLTRQKFDALATADSNYQELERFIAENRGKNTGLALNLGFGRAVLEDPNSKVINKGEATVKVPSETYRLWRIKQDLEEVKVLFNTNQGDPINSSLGKSSAQSELQLRDLLDFAK